MLNFNLVREKWIPCLLPNGTVQSYGLAEVLSRAHEITEITDESPLVVASLHRLLLAIVHRIFGPNDTEAWGALWQAGCFPAEPLNAYWEKWEHRFNLLDETAPFYQSAAITEADDPKRTNILEFQRSAGNNATLFDHTTDDSCSPMNLPLAARALMTHQTFSLGGPVGYLKGSETDREKTGCDSPAARGAVCLLTSENAHRTLMLNLTDYGTGAKNGDHPSWEDEISQGKGERTPNGRVDLFTWQSRRSRLFVAGNDPEKLTVSHVKLVPGYSVPLMWNPFRDETMQAFVLKRDPKPEERPWYQYRVTQERAAWRDSITILYGIREARLRCASLTWVARLVEEGELPENFSFGVEVMGASTEQQKLQLWRRDRLPIRAGLLRDENCRSSLSSALRYSEDIAFALVKAGEKLAEQVLAPTVEGTEKQKADPKRVKALAQSLGVEFRYWSCLETKFLAFLSELGSSLALGYEEERRNMQNGAFDAWMQAVGASAKGAFASAVGAVGKSARGLRAAALAEIEFSRRVASIDHKLQNPGEGGQNDD